MDGSSRGRSSGFSNISPSRLTTCCLQTHRLPLSDGVNLPAPRISPQPSTAKKNTRETPPLRTPWCATSRFFSLLLRFRGLHCPDSPSSPVGLAPLPATKPAKINLRITRLLWFVQTPTFHKRHQKTRFFRSRPPEDPGQHPRAISHPFIRTSRSARRPYDDHSDSVDHTFTRTVIPRNPSGRRRISFAMG